MLLVPVPFFILAAAVFAVNGNEVDDYELSVLDQAIKGVRFPSPIYSLWVLTHGRPLRFSQTSLQPPLGEQL
jgi:hypothetical protein